MFYLQAISISGFDSAGDYLAVALGSKTLKAHKTTRVTDDMSIGSLYGLFLICKMALHRFEESRVVVS
jgi:hypothetical protein